MCKKLLSLFFAIALLTTSFIPSYASIGVGVGTGKIVVDEELKPGQIYVLPPVTVLNTGDEESEYTVSVTYHEQQPELRPPLEWFTFSPKEFTLKPGEAQRVDINLNVPINTEPGNYFTYLEASPLKKSTTNDGKTSVGIAAASKLYFKIVPASILQGIYYRIISLWKLYSPWTDRVAIGLGVVAALFILSRFFKVELKSKKKDKSENTKSNE